MTRLQTDFIAQILTKHLQKEVPAELDCVGVETDSRKPSTGGLFVALAGDRFDGHDYVTQMLDQGAAAALVHKFLPDYEKHTDKLIVVDDTLKGLQMLAQGHLLRMPAFRIGVTGSNGKTTTKELIKAALEKPAGKGAVHANAGNFNNHIGLPLSALQTNAGHRFAILEMGMNHFGEIRTLASIAKPQVGVITNIGTAHAGNLGGVRGVAEAKGELFEYLAQTDGILIVNADDPRCIKQSKKWPQARQLQFGKSSMADIQIQKNEIGLRGLSLTLAHGHKIFRIELPLVGLHNAWNAASAMAVALASDVPLEQAAEGLMTAAPAKGRLQVRYVEQSQITLLDDTYNANPESMEMGLKTLLATPGQRRIAVLGEMLELGEFAETAHRSLGAAVAQKRIDALFCCGDLSHFYVEGARAEGMQPEHLFWAPQSEALGGLLKAYVTAGDTLLIKGSRGSQMEKTIESLEHELVRTN